MHTPRLPVEAELRASRSFREGLLLDVVAVLKQTRSGGLFAVEGDRDAIEDDLTSWCELTGNPIVGRTVEDGRVRWVVRRGAPVVEQGARSVESEPESRTLGSRLWLYTNFDCNLACDYCCVRSSPTAPRRELGLETIRRIMAEAVPLGVKTCFLTGGEPFLLPDIVEILDVVSAAMPATVLTNGMLLKGSKLDALEALDRSRLTFQVSVDSPTAELHDLHRGKGTWDRALRGIEAVRARGFRVRVAASVSTAAEEARFLAWLDRENVAEADRVVRRILLRGVAEAGLALARAELVPELTITAEGVFWHPVGAEDTDLLVTPRIFPLAEALREVHAAVLQQQAHGHTLASVFHCA